MAIHILIVDDSAAFRQDLHTAVMSHSDWEICGEAVDGYGAIEKNRQLSPELIVMDLSMPRMNGLEAAVKILQEFPNRRIVLLTLYASHQLADQAHEAGIRGTLSKAAALDHIEEGIEAVLRGEEFVSI